jgi:cytochrome c551
MSAPMAVLGFVALFVALALLAFFLGMSGGSSGHTAPKPVSRRGRRSGVVLFLIALVGLGFAIPAVVIATDKDDTAIPAAGVKSLTPLQEHGRELFGEKCKSCHTLLAAKATARVGPNLDELRPPKALVLDAINNGRARGNGNMAAQLVEGEDAEAVAQFVAVAVGNPAN